MRLNARDATRPAMPPPGRPGRRLRARLREPLPASAAIAAIVAMLGGALPLRAIAEQVRVCTSSGDFTIELKSEAAPQHVAKFLGLVDSGFYNGTVVHRAIEGRLVQAGAYDRGFVRRAAGDPVVNESRNGLTNRRGTVAAARLRDPDSATSQFFVNLSDSSELDATSRRPGYTVFGHVTDGMDVLDVIGALPTGAAGPLSDEVPMPQVVIEAITRIMDRSADDDALSHIDARRAACEPVTGAMLLEEADAALNADRTTRARYALDQYFVTAPPTDPDMTQAQSLFRRLPREAQSGIGPLVAHCPRAGPPAMPDGRRASLAEMEAAQAGVRSFITASEAYLECLSEVIDGGSLDDLQEVAAVSEHNEVVAAMERTAEQFNETLRVYRSRN